MKHIIGGIALILLGAAVIAFAVYVPKFPHTVGMKVSSYVSGTFFVLAGVISLFEKDNKE